MRRILLATGAILLAASLARAQPRTVQDYPGAWLPEFRVEANLVGSRIDNEDFQGELGNRMSVKEAGVGLRAYVDPFFRLDAVFSGEEGAGESEFGVEQVQATWIAAPLGTEWRFGKFQTSFGEYNDDDPDEHPQVTAPSIIENYWGEDDGYIDTGVNGNIYLPLPGADSHIFWLGAFNGENTVAFHGGAERRSVIFSRYEAFWQVGDISGVEFGASYLEGPNQRTREVELSGGNTGEFTVSGDTKMWNVHLEFDFSPGRRYLYSGFSLLGEYYWQRRGYDRNPDLETAVDPDVSLDRRETTEGYYLLGEYRLGRNWGVSARVDRSPILLAEFEEEGEGDEEGGIEAEPGAYTIYHPEEQEEAYSAMISYYPSDFTSTRFEYRHRNIGEEEVNEYWLQLQVLIGFERPDVF